MKFRIVRIIHNVNELKFEDGKFTQEYMIEEKRYGLWKEVMQTDIWEILVGLKFNIQRPKIRNL
jgi:hypothetical protein